MTEPFHKRPQPPRKLVPPIRHAPRSQIRARILAWAWLTNSYSVKVVLGTADATPRPGPDGLIRIWLDRKFVDRLGHMRGPGESYSDVILRFAKT